jgi:AraC-like DNA-binding protein
MTVAQYCQTQRMNEAARLLEDDSLTIYRVAELVGYEFPGNFTAAFKRHFGVSPKSFRR